MGRNRVVVDREQLAVRGRWPLDPIRVGKNDDLGGDCFGFHARRWQGGH